MSPVLFSEGDVNLVPEVYKEHRINYSRTPIDIESFRKQLMYRCGRYGTKELEIILTDWFKETGVGLTFEQLELFDH